MQEGMLRRLGKRISEKIRERRLRRKLNRAFRLMEKPELSLRERVERDKIAGWLGEKGGWEGNSLLKSWAIFGPVMLRPDPDVLGRAIARGGEDSTHLHIVAHASVDRDADFNTNYYFARLLAAECGELGKNGHDFEPRRSITYFICSGADRMVRFIQETNPGLVREFERERNAD
ncbi:MAG: hypothetical protein AB1657_01935 [Candidatus Micrarchaeota archaeon]